MKIVREEDLAQQKEKQPICLTLGMFDGVHKGHVYLLGQLRKKAEQLNVCTGVISFEPHPAQILRGLEKDFLLNTERERIDHLAQTSYIDYIYFIAYDRKISNMSAQDFLENKVLNYFKLSHFLIGHDSRFGNRRQGDANLLIKMGKQHNFGVSEVDAIVLGCLGKINSTTIRQQLKNHKIKEANRLLGYDYLIRGTVVRGDQRGRTIGFPTANIDPHDGRKLIPKDGVYAVEVKINSAKYTGMIFGGMMNIGIRPTFDVGDLRVAEVHIFNFEDDIYGVEIQTSIKTVIRQEKKFHNVSELVDQLNQDKKAIQKLLLSK